MFDSIMEAVFSFQKRVSKAKGDVPILSGEVPTNSLTYKTTQSKQVNKKKIILNLYKHQVKIYIHFSI